MSNEVVIEVDENALLAGREAHAYSIVRNYMAGNAAVSLIPVPVFDLVALTGVQVKMVHSLAKLYGLEFSDNIVRGMILSLASTLGAFTVSVTLALSALKFVPGIFTPVGVLALPVTSAALTWAVGRVFILHFEMGGTLLNFDPKKMHDHFRNAYQEGIDLAKSTPTATKSTVVVDKTTPVEKTVTVTEKVEKKA